jgi:large subunit ribosomal protein L17
MRHKVVSSTFGRSTAHRKAMLSAIVCGLINEKRITTTLKRAKSVRGLAERMVTLAKNGSVAARRRAVSVLRRKDVVAVLFNEIAPKCGDRSGGYVRIARLGRRRGDKSDMAVMEWVSINPVDKKKKKKSEAESEAEGKDKKTS